MRPDLYEDNVRPDGTASYFELNPDTPAESTRDLGWDGLVVEREHFHPFDNGEVVYDEHFLAVLRTNQVRILHGSEDGRYEGLYRDGDIIISPAGQPIHWRLENETDASLLIFSPDRLRQVAAEIMEIDPSRISLLDCPKTRDPVILRLAERMQSATESRSTADRLHVDSLFNALAVHLLTHYSTAPPPDRPPSDGLPLPRLRMAIDAIQGGLERGVSLAEVAEAAGLSPSHFVVLFKRATGLAPHQYLLRCRIERAKELLRHGDPPLSLGRIAQQAGFCDQSHLTRHFKRLVGVTPAVFRKQS